MRKKGPIEKKGPTGKKGPIEKKRGPIDDGSGVPLMDGGGN